MGLSRRSVLLSYSNLISRLCYHKLLISNLCSRHSLRRSASLYQDGRVGGLFAQDVLFGGRASLLGLGLELRLLGPLGPSTNGLFTETLVPNGLLLRLLPLRA